MTENEADEIVRRFETAEEKITANLIAAFNSVSPHPIEMQVNPIGMTYKGRLLKIPIHAIDEPIDPEEVGMKIGYSTKE